MTAGPHEIELKFALSDAAAGRLERDALRDGEVEELASTYFDTPDLQLRRAGVAVRLRQAGDRWVQTLKAANAGAVSRYEAERVTRAGRLDPELFPKGAMAALGVRRADGLQPVFETRVERRTRLAERPGAKVEWALDVGEIRAGEARVPIRELELELKTGGLRALFAEARPLVGEEGVWLSLVSKAERGYRLAGGDRLEAVKFEAPSLDFTGPARAGLQALALAALHQLSANADVLREAPRPEAVHQARVATRRLRTFLGAFRDQAADSQSKAVKARLRRLAALFADARALDVFEHETFRPLARPQPGSAAFGQALLRARTRAYAKVQAGVGAPAFARDLFDLVEWTLCGPWTRAALAPAGAQALGPVARALLEHRWKVMGRRARGLDWADPHARHKLRIQAKKMRYLTEAFAGEGAGKLLKRLAALQDQLGALNDIATAEAAARLALQGAGPDAAYAAGEVVGLRRAEAAGRVEAARKAWKKLAREDCPAPAGD